jgi:hypothetical protein
VVWVVFDFVLFFFREFPVHVQHMIVHVEQSLVDNDYADDQADVNCQAWEKRDKQVV